jgi:hypothetical protein
MRTSETPTPAHPSRNNWSPPREPLTNQFATPTPTCASPSHPCVADLRQRFPEPPGPCEARARANKLASFRDEFPEPPRKTTEWKSAPSGYLKSYRSRFSPVSSGTHTSFRKPPRGSVPNYVTWASTFSRSFLSSTPHPQSSGRQPLRRGTNSPSCLAPGPRAALASWKTILPTGKPISPRAHASRDRRRALRLASLGLRYAVQPALRLTSK